MSGTHIDASTPMLAPGTLNDVTVTNPSSLSGTISAGFLADFTDVPQDNIFHDDVEKVFRAGITAGCGAGAFCVASPVTRAQMAVFLLKAEHGSSYVPPACTGVFDDVACPSGVRRLDRTAVHRRHHRGLRRRQLLSGEPGAARPDGRVPSEDSPRKRLRAADLLRRLRGRDLSRALHRLDRAALHRRHHGRLFDDPAPLLPGLLERARADGRRFWSRTLWTLNNIRVTAEANAALRSAFGSALPTAGGLPLVVGSDSRADIGETS